MLDFLKSISLFMILTDFVTFNKFCDMIRNVIIIRYKSSNSLFANRYYRLIFNFKYRYWFQKSDIDRSSLDQRHRQKFVMEEVSLAGM